MSAQQNAQALDQITSSRLEAPDRTTNEQWFVTLYDDLHRIARRELRSRVGTTLSPTTLLHETFLDISQRNEVAFPDRARFVVYAARAMRGLIIDYSRKRQAYKRGSEFELTSLPTDFWESTQPDLQLEKLNEALDALTQIDARLAECVDLKFFCGLSFAEIAGLRQVSERTVQRDWDKARVLLHRFMNETYGAVVPDAR